MALDEFDLKHKERVGMRRLAVATVYMSPQLENQNFCPCVDFRSALSILSAVDALLAIANSGPKAEGI